MILSLIVKWYHEWMREFMVSYNRRTQTFSPPFRGHPETSATNLTRKDNLSSVPQFLEFQRWKEVHEKPQSSLL